MMLILHRRLGQSILIGDNIKIVVLRNRKGYMSIGIKAPIAIKILREELLSRKHRRCVGNRKPLGNR